MNEQTKQINIALEKIDSLEEVKAYAPIQDVITLLAVEMAKKIESLEKRIADLEESL